MAPVRKIYFCGSIRAGRDDAVLYARIVEILGKYGTILTPCVGDPNITAMGSSEDEAETDKEIHDQNIKLLEECHVIVAEVTQPSLGVGYEIGRGVALGKKILCLYRPQPDRILSAMIRGAEMDGVFTTMDYKEEDLPVILEEFFSVFKLRSKKDSLDWNTYEPM